MPVASTRSVNVPESISSVMMSSNSFSSDPRCVRSASRAAGEVADASDRDGAAQQPRPEQPLVQAHQAFPQRLGPTRGNGERHVGRQRADVGDVVVDALELQQDHTQHTGTRGYLHSGQSLDRMRVGQSMAHSRVARNRLCQEQAVPPGEPLEALLDSLVDVEEPELQVQHRLTGHPEAKVARLDDAGMDGSYRYFEDALAGHRTKRVSRSADPCDSRVVWEVLAKRPGLVRPVVMQRDALHIGMARGNEAKEVHRLALEPVRRRVLRCNRRECGLAWIHRRHDVKERTQSRQEPDVMNEEVAVP
jgi:hypothetical protein